MRPRSLNYLLKKGPLRKFANCFFRILETDTMVSNQKSSYLWLLRTLETKVIHVFIQGPINLPLTWCVVSHDIRPSLVSDQSMQLPTGIFNLDMPSHQILFLLPDISLNHPLVSPPNCCQRKLWKDIIDHVCLRRLKIHKQYPTSLKINYLDGLK